jgi:hypothetical protein
MSMNAKTISLSAAALLAIAGGAYAFMPGSSQDVSESVAIGQEAAVRGSTDAQMPSTAAIDTKAGAESANGIVAPPLPGQEQPIAAAPKKLTQRQLTPPPLTEDEKLQKAAEQESNF